MIKRKLLILGNARHGKDTFAEILRDRFGMTFQSSSQAAADIFIYDELKEKFGYKTPEECFEDRVNHRPLWHQMIKDYNEPDKARLAKGILERNDCYVGMRDHLEIAECMKQGLFDIIIWVDASARLPLEGSDSFNIDPSCADFIVENNGTLEEFEEKVLRIGRILFNMEPINTDHVRGFKEFVKNSMSGDEFDLFEFISSTNIKDWPKVMGEDGEYEPLGLENWTVKYLSDIGMAISCGNDYQPPHTLIIKFDGENSYVESYRPHKFSDGLSKNEILEILGFELTPKK